MYDPKGNGKERSLDGVQFEEIAPPAHLQGIVHRFLTLKTEGALSQDYRFHALPDACTYVVFDQHNRDIMGVSQLRAQAHELNLGKEFHFVNIRFLPGVWQTTHAPITLGAVDTPYDGPLPFADVNRQLQGLDLAQAAPALIHFVEHLMEHDFVARNRITEQILENIDEVNSVADMARIVGVSARQLQRSLKQSTGFAPHDFLKVLRLQQSLKGDDTWSYADQSHFIRSFHQATGYTPVKHTKKFDV